ncbi:MAG TPA: metallophosphoesterase [Terracidiphilus sp.]|jgi:sphingomyelin phosphodiesterase acid-like 3|nr:metallophosphoesterase [Terracidiphilus sp.]
MPAQSASVGAESRAVHKAQVKSPSRQQVRALFASDIHFEPFWDPDKVPQLASAPVSQWRTILTAPISRDRTERFSALQLTCASRGTDTSYTLFDSSLHAMELAAPGAKFITLSGDLIAHRFSCKYMKLMPQSTPEEFRQFVEKTIKFVLDSLRTAFPDAPVYAALGNNDSDCDDYRLDTNSDFLGQTGVFVAEGFPVSQRRDAQRTFAADGYYSVSLPVPLEHTQLLVLDDVFMSRNYTTCSGKADSAGAEAQIDWLRQQLTEAREKKKRVWVMSHIPPGIDPFSTAIKLRNVCGGKAPDMFLTSDALPDLLAEFGDVIQLAIFGHTHMDEMRLLKTNGEDTGASQPGVAVKMVPSISPIDGNMPSFTVALVDSPSAKLVDFQVFASSNESGIDATWKEEYDYADAYKQSDFSAESLTRLVAGFQADSDASTEASKTYLRNYYVRDRSLELRLFWTQYVCAVSTYSIDAYRNCRCSKSKE